MFWPRVIIFCKPELPTQFSNSSQKTKMNVMKLSNQEFYFPPELWEIIKSYFMGIICAEYLQLKRYYAYNYSVFARRSKVPSLKVIIGAMNRLSVYGLYSHVLSDEERVILRRYHRLQRKRAFWRAEMVVADSGDEMLEVERELGILSMNMKCTFIEFLESGDYLN